ncbi:MAG: heme-binding protein [Chloroflexi bacterium]|nr:heme-binding protein [Chloroflexota bacterium]
MPITLREAERVLKAAESSAISQDLKVSIAVVDTRGDLVITCRMDGARYFTPDIARGKAMASAMFNAPSGTLAERANSPVMQTLNQMNLGRLVFGQGALPIVRGSEVLGAVGVSGATSQQDEDIAKAALAAL